MFDRRSSSERFRMAVRKLGWKSSGGNEDTTQELGLIFHIPHIAATQHVEDSSKFSTGLESFQADNGTDWSGVLNAWLDACESSAKVPFVVNQVSGRAAQCYESQAVLHAAFNQIFASSLGNALVPALIEVCKSTHRFAVAADHEIASRDHAKLNNAALLLQESYSKSYNDRKELQPSAPYDEEGSKKAAVLFIVNELFKIYFRLNTLRLCKNVAKPTEAKKLHELGTMGQMVTYKYFSGRLCLFEDNFVDAEQNLEYALSNCPNSAIHNKRCILRYLIPVKLYRGKLPTTTLLEQFQLNEFTSLVDGIRKGDLRIFNDALLDNQHRFIRHILFVGALAPNDYGLLRQGTYLLLERCKTVCYRSLIKRIHLLNNKSTIPLDQVVAAFLWLNIHIDIDEVECILANLIYRGIIRGYIAHTKRMLVLSKSNAFPVENIGR